MKARNVKYDYKEILDATSTSSSTVLEEYISLKESDFDSGDLQGVSYYDKIDVMPSI